LSQASPVNSNLLKGEGGGQLRKDNSCTAFVIEIKIEHSCTKQRNVLQARKTEIHTNLLVTKHPSVTDLVKPDLVGYLALPGGILTSLAPARFLKATGQFYFSLVNNLVSLVMPVNL